MQALLYVTAQAGQPRADLYKVASLLIAVAITTATWVSALMAVFYAVGINLSASFFVAVGLVIATLSGVGIAFIMANR